ncbi:hypothetical protein BH23THE1_BH23THE1_12980 [soil metagenome]
MLFLNKKEFPNDTNRSILIKTSEKVKSKYIKIRVSDVNCH